jgi:ubiquinone/menaquinone biosynthesis C-methylase UbiE
VSKNYKYFSDEQDKDFYINSMKKYVETKQGLDQKLEELIIPIIQNNDLKILDACCGIGHLDYFFSSLSPGSTFFGIDQTSFLIDEAKKLCSDKKNVSFEVDDLYNMPEKYPKSFDVSINWKTISWLPYYDECIKSLFSVTKKHIFLSSLFYDGDIDFEIKVREYKKEKAKTGFNQFYNVYSYPRFEKFLYDLGAKSVKSYNFEIDIDIPKPPIDHMGTYTMTVDNGKRIQISGPILMLWKIVQIDL